MAGRSLAPSRGQHPARNKTRTLELAQSEWSNTTIASSQWVVTSDEPVQDILRRCKLCLTDLREPLRERDFDTLKLVVTARVLKVSQEHV